MTDVPRITEGGKRVRGREWAVLESVFRGVHIHKGGLRTQEEAEAWLAALEITLERQDHEHFMKTDGITARDELYIAYRDVGPWKEPNE